MNLVLKFTAPGGVKRAGNDSMYQIKTTQFEGPLDLLLRLIEKRKVSINNISLSDIADQYLEHLKQLRKFPLEEAAVFVVIASTLMLIKSRSLMPSMELTEEEEQSIEELEGRLRVYRRIRQLSRHISELFGKNPIFSREAFKNIEIGFVEPKGITVERLHSVLKEIVENLATQESLPEAEVKKIITLEDKIKELAERVQNSLQLSFSEFSASSGGMEKDDKKIEIIVSFLAMLELIKQGIIMVRQENLFDSINIHKH